MKANRVISTFQSIEDIAEGGHKVEVNDAFAELVMKGDKRCEFKIGDRVKKKTYEEGDVHQIGTKGIAIGSLYVDDMPEDKKEAYLVQFEDGPQHPCFTVKYKLELV